MKQDKKPGQAVALPASGVDPFKAYANSVSPTTIVGVLLKFSKGEYLAGRDSVPIKVGMRFIANLDAAMAGWVRWINGRPTDHALVRIADGVLPAKRELLGDLDQEKWQYDLQGQPRDPWQEINYLPLAGVDGEIYTLSISSIAGLREVASLCSAYAEHRAHNADEFPEIELGVGSFQHRERSIGRVKFPELNILGWQPKENFNKVMVLAGLINGTAPAPTKPDKVIEKTTPPTEELEPVDDMDDEIPF
jgi:hypothetical protein